MLETKEVAQNSWVFQNDFPPGVQVRFDQALDEMDVGNVAKAEDLLRDVLLVCPEHIDVWHHLALLLDGGGDAVLAYACTREAVRLGLDALPKDFSWLNSRLEWGHLENRPFLRAYHRLGLHQLEHGDARDALEPFARLLAVNPRDNLGVRYLLTECWLALEDWESVLNLSLRFQNDFAPDIEFAKVIALLGVGDEVGALESLKQAVHSHPKVVRELLKTRHVRPKAAVAGAITLGGDDEAFSYWERNKAHWAKGTRAYELLQEVVGRKTS